MGLIGTIGTAVANASTSSITVTLNTTIAAGNTIIGALAVDSPSTTNPTLNITDTHGNTYSVDKQQASNVTVSATIFSCVVTTQINSGDSITIQATNGARSRWAATVQAFDDVLTSPLDQTASNAASSASLSSGVTAATTNANELVYATFGFALRTFTPGVGFTAATQVATSAGSTDRSINSEWKYINSTGAQEATGTISSSATYAGLIATYKSQTVANQNPTANAGPDQTVAAQQIVTLDGTGSSDTDGTISSYTWAQISGPTVTLSSNTAAQPTFTAPVASGGTSLVFGLTVTDNAAGTSAQDTVTITVGAPVGYVATAATGTYGSTSTVGTNTFSFTKTVVAGHTLVGSLVLAGSTAPPTLTVTDTQGNTYVVDAQTSFGSTAILYIFSSRVSHTLTASDTITLTINTDFSSRWAVSVEEFDNIRPSAIDKVSTNGALNATSFTSGTTATTTSADEVVFGAFGYACTSARTFTPGTGFTATAQQVTSGGSFDRGLSNEYRIVNAAAAQAATGTISVASTYAGAAVTYKAYSISGNQSPTASAGNDQSATVNTMVTLNGSGSSDTDGTIATYSWRQISGTSVSLSSTSVASPTFTTPASPTTLVFGLTVTDNLGASSAEDNVTIFVGSQLGYIAEAVAGTKQTTATSITLNFSKSVSSGHTLLIGITVDATGVSDSSPVFSASDTQGNTYSVDGVTYRASTLGTAIISCYVSNALAVSDTLTISCTTSRNRWAVTGSEFDNIAQSSLDKTATNSVASTTNLSTATTAATVNQYEIIFATFGFSHTNGQTFSPGAHYTQAGSQPFTTSGSGDRTTANEYRFFSTSIAHTATATLSAASGYGSVIATYAATSIGNQLPSANAGSNQTVDPYVTVTLDGTASSDEDGLVTSYAWSQTAGPTVTLSSNTAAQPTFTAPGSDGGTTLTFSLVVTDNSSGTSINSATVNITVNSADSFIAHSGSWTAMPEYAAHADTWS